MEGWQPDAPRAFDPLNLERHAADRLDGTQAGGTEATGRIAVEARRLCASPRRRRAARVLITSGTFPRFVIWTQLKSFVTATTSRPFFW